jgi:hypothetical protein
VSRLGTIRGTLLAGAVALAGCAAVLTWLDPRSAPAAGVWAAALIVLPLAWLERPACWSWRQAALPAGVFVVALAPRLLWIDHLPLGLHGDEAAHALIAQDILRNGLTNAYADHGWGIPVWGFLWQVGFVGVLGPSITAVRAASSVAGALTVVVAFLWARELAGLSVALIAAALLVLAHTHLLLSHLGTVNSQAPLLTTLTILLLTISWQRRSGLAAALAASAFAFTFLNWAGDRIIVPVVGLAIVMVLVARRNRALLKPVAIFVLGVGLLAVAPAVYYLKSPDGLNLILARSDKSIFSPEGWNHTLSTVDEPSLRAVLDRQATRTVDGLAPGGYGDASTFYRFDRPFTDPLTLAAAGLGLAALALLARKPGWILPPLMIALTLISTPLIVDPPNFTRLALMLTSLIVLAAFGIDAAPRGLARLGLPRAAAHGLAIALVVAIAALNAVWFFVDYPREGEGEFTLLALANLAREYQLPVYVVTPNLNYNHEDLRLLDPQHRVQAAPADPSQAATPALWVAVDQASLPRLTALQSELPPSTVAEVTDNGGREVLVALVPAVSAHVTPNQRALRS